MPGSRHTYSFPTRIEYGPGAMTDLPAIIKQSGLRKGLLVSDPGIEEVGTPEILRKAFDAEGMEIVTFSDVVSNPTDENVYAGTKIYKDKNCRFIVALGGGSPIDVGKTIKVMATHDGPVEKYDDAKGGDRYIQNDMPPFYAIPTTAGTGSEVGRSSVVTVKRLNKKMIIFSPYMMPDIAVLDPKVTLSLPPGLTAATGIDAFVHNLEAYLMDTFHPFADGLAKEGLSRCFKYLPVAVKNGENLQARGEMLMASAMGATAFQKGLGLNHAIAHALSVFYDTHHGLANAAVLVEVMKFNQRDSAVAAKLAALGTVLGTQNDADAVIKTINNLVTSINMPTNLQGIGIENSQIQALEDYALNDPLCSLNPAKVNTGDVVKIIENLL